MSEENGRIEEEAEPVTDGKELDANELDDIAGGYPRGGLTHAYGMRELNRERQMLAVLRTKCPKGPDGKHNFVATGKEPDYGSQLVIYNVRMTCTYCGVSYLK